MGANSPAITIAAADIGSIKAGNFGWALERSAGSRYQGTDIDEFCAAIAESIDSGETVCLGFEAPLFVPVRDVAINVASARKGEGNRSWSAGAGTGALATGLVESLYIFRKLKQACSTTITPVFHWNHAIAGQANFFIWEAFVTADAKGSSHEDDAILALEKFKSGLPNPDNLNAIEPEGTFSLVGAALIRSGLTMDLDFLGQPVLVVKV